MLRRHDTIVTFGLSAALGVLLGFSFPTPGWSWLAIPAVAGLTFLVRTGGLARANLAGLGFGAAAFTYTLAWGSAVGPDAWLGLSLLSTAFMPIATTGIWITRKLPGWPIWSAGCWVLCEALRSRIPFGGFSWSRLAFSTPGTPLAHTAAIGGAPLATFAVALCAGLLVLVISSAAHRRSRTAVAAAVTLVAIVLGARAIPLPIAGQTGGGVPRTIVALVQGDVAKPGLDFLGRPEQVLQNHVRETVRLAAMMNAGSVPRPDLVIWPENASDLDPGQDPSAAALITTAARALGQPILVGAVVQAPGDPQHLLNVGIVWDPQRGAIAQYAKQHLVPFGEYVPFRSQLARLISRFARIPRDFAPGHVPGVLKMGQTTLGDVLCFEIAYDQIPTAAVRAGARVLVIQTNNATYGRTSQPAQQLAISRLRAIEHGRAVVIAATSGITAVIAPDGRIAEQAPTFVPAVIVRSIPLRDTLTVADRLQDWPERLICLLTLLAIVAGVRQGRISIVSRNSGSSVSEKGAPRV
ncbi:MAG: apolipoprotein N-acyltransferase [Actinomycetes bacterium]